MFQEASSPLREIPNYTLHRTTYTNTRSGVIPSHRFRDQSPRGASNYTVHGSQRDRATTTSTSSRDTSPMSQEVQRRHRSRHGEKENYRYEPYNPKR